MKQRREEKRREEKRREEKRIEEKRRREEEKRKRREDEYGIFKEVVIALAFMTGREQVRTLQRGEQWRRRSVGLDCSML